MVSSAEGVDLELDDIQSGALHERPSPYAGTYLLLRIDDRAAGRELVRRLHSVVDHGRPSTPKDGSWRTIQVKVDRPGAVVRSRAGYYAVPMTP